MEVQVISSTKGNHPHLLSTSILNFPIWDIVILSATVTVLLLIGYCAFTTRCCSNRPRLDLIINRWICCIFQPTREEEEEEQDGEDSFIALSPATWANHGLDVTAIRGIPTFNYIGGEAHHKRRTNFSGCTVCLNEFKEQDVLRALPNCRHAFHTACIDVWLQGNANCPLCRTSISGSNARFTDNDCILAPSSSPQGSHSYPDSLLGGDENFFVIELMGREEAVVVPNEGVERNRSTPMPQSRKRTNGSSMGDECIDILRDQQDDSSMVQPMIRRYFSLDSAADRHIYLSVQAAVRGKNRGEFDGGSSEGYSGKVRRSLFSFSHGRRSRNAVQPLDFKL